MMMDSGWSTRFSPTPGRSATRGMLREASCEAGPRPERSMRRGVSTAPAQRMVSRLGLRVRLVPLWRVKLMPVQVALETLILLTQALVRMVRPGFFSSPRRSG